MGLSKKREPTNLATLRNELNRLNVSATPVVDNNRAEQPAEPKAGSGCGAIIKEAKKRGRKRGELIDGSRLFTC